MKITTTTSENKVEIAAYNNNWPQQFQHEAERIRLALGAQLKAIHHIGSTAIPNMPAKPIIDILMECDNLDEIDAINEQLLKLHYSSARRQIIPHKSYITARHDDNTSFHLHIYERGDPQVRRHVNFRDYVIQHQDAARDYATLKIKLAKEFSDDRKQYVMGKNELVQEIDTKARHWPDRKKDYLKPNTGPLPQCWTREKLLQAIIANMNIQMTHFAQYLNQATLIRIPGYTLVNTSLPDDTFNYVIDTDFSAADVNPKIIEVSHYFTSRHIPFSWWVSPYDRPENLAACLEHNGYTNTENNHAMYFNLNDWHDNSPPLSQLKIIQATTKQALQDFAMILAINEAAFEEYFSWLSAIITEDDPISYYVGYVNNKPVVRSLTCYYAQVAGFYCLSTAPDERNKGYGSAMHAYQLSRAQKMGYHVAVLQASADAHASNKKLGYQDCGVFKEFKLK